MRLARIERHNFEKGYLPQFSEEIFQIRKIEIGNPHLFFVRDLNNVDIEGGLYAEELQKVDYNKNQLFHIDKIIKKRGNKYLVSFKGYPDSFNQWIPKSNISTL